MSSDIVRKALAEVRRNGMTESLLREMLTDINIVWSGEFLDWLGPQVAFLIERRRRTWVTRAGEEIPLNKMEDDHIEAILSRWRRSEMRLPLGIRQALEKEARFRGLEMLDYRDDGAKG